MKQFPIVLTKMDRLEELSLIHNQISSVPEDVSSIYFCTFTLFCFDLEHHLCCEVYYDFSLLNSPNIIFNKLALRWCKCKAWKSCI